MKEEKKKKIVKRAVAGGIGAGKKKLWHVLEEILGVS